MTPESSSPQDEECGYEPSKNIQTSHTADRAAASVTYSYELHSSDNNQGKMGRGSDVYPVEHQKTKDKHKGAQCQGSFTKSLHAAELQKRFHTNRKNEFRNPRDDASREYANEDNFVACQDFTSCSSRRLQHVERTLLSLSPQYRVVRGGSHNKWLSSSGGLDFYHQHQRALFGQHCAELQHLLEQRAQLLFLHEYGRRCRGANCFISRLGEILERARLLAAHRGDVLEDQSNISWNLGLRGMCEELQLHVGHWDLLYAKARSDPFLRRVVWSHTEMLGSMQRTLCLLSSQALLLIEQCIYTQLRNVAAAQLVCLPTEVLEDVLSAVKLYNHILSNQKSQRSVVARSLQLLHSSDLQRSRTGLFRKSLVPAAFLVEEILAILARRRAQNAAEQLYNWTLQLDLADFKYPNPCFQMSSDQILRSLHMHLFSLVQKDRKEILETFLQALASSTNLLAPYILKKAPIEPTDTTKESSERNHRGSKGHGDCSGHQMDQSKLDACGKLFSQYSAMMWREFDKAVISQFYYSSNSTTVTGLNQWGDQTMRLLVTWLRKACEEECISGECKDALQRFCSHIQSTAAFIQWDKMMCKSIGSGLKDKCLPRDMEQPSVRTATMELTLQLFPPLFSVLHLLQSSDSNSDAENAGSFSFLQIGLMHRAQATVQSSAFWVMSKAYQYLASWSLTKFLLVTQGDLKVLMERVQKLTHQMKDVGEGAEHQLMLQHGLQLTHVVSQLSAFSESVLRSFSTDCKKMSVEIFEQTMPSAKHWRVNYRTELPSSPSEYAAFAAQSVIGQVLEGVQALPDEARIPALAEAMTAFMEGWMEHILKQKIKFSIQGALQLKQDFDSIRELLRSEKYSLSEELHRRLLSLRVFYKVDSAIVCLLQQPVAKPYMPSRRWEPFRKCCPNRAQVVDQVVGSLNNLETLDNQIVCHQALTQAEHSVTPELLSTVPPASYLAAEQQEWLDLRINSGSRWKLPGLRCFTKSEP